MPIALLIIGAIFLVAGIRGKQDELFSLLKSDFTGQGNFTVWLLALAFVGALGYIPGFKPVANAFLALVIVVLLLAHGDFFKQLSAGINTTIHVTQGDGAASSPQTPGLAGTQPSAAVAPAFSGVTGSY